MNREEELALAVARALVRAGVPVFAAPPVMVNREWDPTGGTCGYQLPRDWEKTVATENWLDPTVPGFGNKAWRPGWALCAVMGHVIDLLDTDPRNGGDRSRTELIDAGLWPRIYGIADTPSGGGHEFIAALHVGGRDAIRPGLDVKGGRPDRSGRGFAFIAPTTKLSKTTGELAAYHWVQVPDLTALAASDDHSGDGIANIIRAARPSSNGFLGGAVPTEGPIPDGEREKTMFTYACRLRGTSLRVHEARVLMRERWQHCEQPPIASHPYTWPEAEEKLHQVFHKYPRGVMPAIAQATSEGVVKVQEVDAEDEDDFWNAWPVLRHVQSAARAGRAAPWAVLAAVLARVVAATDPNNLLPPLIGGIGASLNFSVALVGESGEGKGAARAISREAVHIPAPAIEHGIGSGEALAHAYVERTKDEEGKSVVRPHTFRALFVVDEISTLSAIKGRQASILIPELCKAVMGEALGGFYVDEKKRLHVMPLTYRFCMIAGVQPRKAGPLFDEADGGYPQRIAWADVTDPDAPDEKPEAPEPWQWRPPVIRGIHPITSRYWMPVCDTARREIDAAALSRLRRERGRHHLDGHALFVRLKAAAALAILDRRLEVTNEDWRLAGVFMARSDRVRDGVLRELRKMHAEMNQGRAKDEAERGVIVSEQTADHHVKGVAKRIVEVLRERPNEWMAHAALRRRIRYDQRRWFDEAIAACIAAGQIEPDDVPGTGEPGRRYRLVP